MSKEQQTDPSDLPCRTGVKLQRAYEDLDDILEDWQLQGMHSHPLYVSFVSAVYAIRAARDQFRAEGYLL